MQTRVQRQVDVVADVRVRERLVEQVEEPDPELDLLIALDREVLEERQVVVDARGRPEVVRRHQRRRFVRTSGTLDAVEIEHLLADIGVAVGGSQV